MPDTRSIPVTIRPRAFIVGFVFAVAICAITPFNNIYRQATPLGGGYFPLAPFYIMFWLMVISVTGKKLFNRPFLLTGSELIVSWVLMVLVSGIAYTGFARTFFINLTAPFYFASEGNRWQQLLQPLLPDALFVKSNTAIDLLYNGIANGRHMGWLEIARQIPWNAWIKPFFSWGIFMIASYFLTMCLISLIHRQAISNERMNFPLLAVPEMIRNAMDSDRTGSFFSNRFLLAGIGIPVALHLLNGLNFYFPSVPHINTLVLAGKYFPEHGIFAGFVKLKIYYYPAFIGFAFLTSRQVSFSFWFFFIAGALFTGILTISGYSFPASELGTTFGPTLSLPEETQMVGAFIVFFLFLAWLARIHFTAVFSHAFYNRSKTDFPKDFRSDILAFRGAILGFSVLLTWFLLHGVSFMNSVLIICFYFMFIMVATRVVCQGGVTYFTLTVAPLDAINTLLGMKLFSSLGLLIAGVTQKVMFLDLRESVAPSLLHAHKISHRRVQKRRMAAIVFLTMVTCLAVSALAMILLCYKYGIRELGLDWATRTTISTYNNLIPAIHDTVEQGDSIRFFAAMGAVVMLLLVICYHRFYWWPLHPIGYLMVYSSAMKILWVSFFIGWLFNVLTMRYGGIKLFEKMRYFFAGLIMGDFLMGGAWAVVGMFTRSAYQVLPT